MSTCNKSRFCDYPLLYYGVCSCRYRWYNTILRNRLNKEPTGRDDPFDDYKKDGSDFPFVTTLHVLNSTIIKLSRAQKARTVFRGTAGGRLPEKFWAPNEDNIRGGVELAFMSTTLNREVAMHYAQADDKPSVVFEIPVSTLIMRCIV